MRIRTRTAGLALLASVVMSSGLLPSSVAGVAAAATCTAGTSTDFNGDSVVDTVVAGPPGATPLGSAAGLRLAGESPPRIGSIRLEGDPKL